MFHPYRSALLEDRVAKTIPGTVIDCTLLDLYNIKERLHE
jgi:hypothetical protein